jgi:hypothetical protein
MKDKTMFSVILSSLIAVLCFTQPGYSSQSKVNNLYLVKKIFIETVANVKEENKTELFLKIELEKKGFKIVDDSSKADAILTGQAQAEVILDGDGSVPNKSIYLYQLNLPSKEIIWKGKVKFISKRTLAEDNEYAAKKIAEKIAKDWKRSAKKSGQNSEQVLEK